MYIQPLSQEYKNGQIANPCALSNSNYIYFCFLSFDSAPILFHSIKRDTIPTYNHKKMFKPQAQRHCIRDIF